MPTVIIHPTHASDSHIAHDGPRARSWTSASAACTGAAVATAGQHVKRDTVEAPDPAEDAQPRHLVVNDDDRSVLGTRRPGWQRHALTATL